MGPGIWEFRLEIGTRQIRSMTNSPVRSMAGLTVSMATRSHRNQAKPSVDRRLDENAKGRPGR